MILPEIEAKLDWKHGVAFAETIEVLKGAPEIRFVPKGARDGEDVYLALGRSDSGRFLSVFFIWKKDETALIINARDMAAKERKWYAKKKH